MGNECEHDWEDGTDGVNDFSICKKCGFDIVTDCE